ncbi:MAG: HGGxSTG domain-containing protein [Alphaproteobacteria bacterium]
MATCFGPDWPGCRWGAKTHQGTPCQKVALKGKKRCRLHGGLSTGPRTPDGETRVIEAHTKHGRRSKDHVARVKTIIAELRQIPEHADGDGAACRAWQLHALRNTASTG